MRFLLYSLSFIYGTIIKLRNSLFNHGILKATKHNIPIICIGNLSVGGSGKTPHTNYIAKLLSKKYKIAILSRGYGRKSSGFNYVNLDSNPILIGDEPLQLKLNNPNCIVAVNNDRNKGVKKILNDKPNTNIVLLDDGFQHRKIQASLNIITTPFYKPFINDKLLPLGRLREPASEAKRSDIILITNTPYNINDYEKKKLKEKLNLKTHQTIYFSSITYEKYKCINNNTELKNENEYTITLVTGIANSNPLKHYLEEKGRKVNLIKFPDHHNYKLKDIKKILLIHNNEKSSKKLILTTEKDATKLRRFLPNFSQKIYYIAIKVKIDKNQKFNKQVLDHVRES